MAITKKFHLMCDEVRIEMGGKLIFLGVYTPDIGSPQFPFRLQNLTFLVWVDNDRLGMVQFSAKISSLETGQPIHEVMGAGNLLKKGEALLPIRFQDIGFPTQGAYTLNIHFGEQDDIVINFNVFFANPQQPMGGR